MIVNDDSGGVICERELRMRVVDKTSLEFRFVEKPYSFASECVQFTE